MSLTDRYDGLLVDLDGTVWNGRQPVDAAVQTLVETSVPAVYVTNNASKAHADVLSKLEHMGLHVDIENVLTSADALLRIASEEIADGARVLVIGSDSLRRTIADAGYQVVDSAGEDPERDRPDAVIQGHNPETGWAQLSEAALAVRAGARYLATNLDASLPRERGFYVGNGAMAAAVTTATGISPLAAGKPQPLVFQLGASRLNASKPLCIGDRLDTDIAGANAAGFESLHVLTGVSQAMNLIEAEEHERPTFIGQSLADITAEPADLRPGPQGGFSARADGYDVLLERGDEGCTPIQALRTVLEVAWALPESPRYIQPMSAAAERAVAGWV